MASYATVVEFREMFSQVPAGAVNDAIIQQHLDRATALIDLALGFSLAAFGITATDKDFYRDTTHDPQYLDLPSYKAASITHVYELYSKGTTAEDTDEVLATEYDILDDTRLFRFEGWPAGWYRVTAIWGEGAADDAIGQVCLEKAMNLFIGAQGGQFSDVVGIEGAGAVGYNRAWTNSQRDVLTQTRLKHGQFGIA